jgi:hypothetical protein
MHDRAHSKCSKEWNGRERVLDRMKEFFGRTTHDARTPARRIAGGFSSSTRHAAHERRRQSTSSTPSDSTSCAGPTAARSRNADRDAAVPRTNVPALLRPRGGRRVLRAERPDAPALAWRGTEVDRAIASWRPEQYVEISTPSRTPTRGAGSQLRVSRQRHRRWKVAMPAFFVKNTRGGERVCNQPAVFDVAAGERRRPLPCCDSGQRSPTLRRTTRAGKFHHRFRRCSSRSIRCSARRAPLSSLHEPSSNGATERRHGRTDHTTARKSTSVSRWI